MITFVQKKVQEKKDWQNWNLHYTSSWLILVEDWSQLDKWSKHHDLPQCHQVEVDLPIWLKHLDHLKTMVLLEVYS